MTYRYYSPDEIIALKTKKIDLVAIAKIDHYIKNPGSHKEGYIKDLYDVTLSQIIIKAGFKIQTYPTGVDSAEQQRLEYIADRLTTHFLKRKLDRIKQPEQLAFKPGSEILDPHHHLNSVYAKDNKHLLSLLPDFGAIYVALRGGPGITLDTRREQEIRDQRGILTDIQFLGRPPQGGLKAKDGSQRLNPTVGYVRGPQAGALFKEGFISQYARQHKDVCRCCDMCGPETQDSWQDLERYLNHTIRHKAEIIRVHIGETHIPSHGKYNVEQLFRLLDQKRADGEIINQVIRLGHGTHMGFQSMTEAAKHGYYVEACLSSNKETGIIGKRKEYPLGPMLLLGVKVMIGTDGGDLYYTDLKTEYAHAKKNIGHFLHAIESGAHEVVKLTNGDKLQYKHVKELFKGIPQAKGWADDKEIEFADLKLIEEICKQKINMHQLVENMNEFKEKMFPGHSKKAALVDESSKHSSATASPEKVDLNGVKLLTGPANRRAANKKPCLEISCPSKEQSDYLAAKLKEQNIDVYEVTLFNKFWRVKTEKTIEAAEAITNIIESEKVKTPLVKAIGEKVPLEKQDQKKQEDTAKPQVKTNIKKQLDKIKEKQDPHLKELLKALDRYKQKRDSFDGSNPEYKRTFFCIGLGFSKTQKLKALAALKNALNGKPEDLTVHLATLRNGELGDTIRTFLKKTDTTSFLGKNVNTVSQLVEHLNEHAQQKLKI